MSSSVFARQAVQFYAEWLSGLDILPAVNRRGFLRRSGVCLNRFGGFLIHREVWLHYLSTG
ncbi:MAG: hypothetical protein JJE36_03610 [Coriobacteriia bacterium]|nr:hypothetical protein [Coriobacteriia bacterium]